jgi:hypothetical protein
LLTQTTAILQRLFQRRWLFLFLSLAIGLISLLFLSQLVPRIYEEYWRYPKLKASDAYIYPQHRYTFLDFLALVWCLDGLLACAFAVRDFCYCRLSFLTVQFFLLFLITFAAMFLGGIAMIAQRRAGF